MKLLKIFTLHLFDGAAAGDGAGTQSAGTDAGADSGEKTGEIIYGKQEPQSDAGTEEKPATSEPTPEERRANYQKLLEEYKDFDTERIQGIINRRFKENKQAEEKMSAMDDVVSMMCAKYGLDGSDLSALRDAVDADNTFWEAGAEEAGMSVEAYKELRRLRQESAQRARADIQSQRQSEMRERISRWNSEAEQCKASYPGFDMNEEVKNPQFMSLLKAGIPVQHAYEVTHLDSLQKAAAAGAAKETEKRVVDNIRAKGARVAENGTSAGAGAIVKGDVHNLSKKDRAEIAKRVQRGEKISF